VRIRRRDVRSGDASQWLARIAIEFYSEIARCLRNDDSTGRKTIEDIFKMERKSMPRDLKSLLEKMS
jgi:hypothetical protein